MRADRETRDEPLTDVEGADEATDEAMDCIDGVCRRLEPSDRRDDCDRSDGRLDAEDARALPLGPDTLPRGVDGPARPSSECADATVTTDRTDRVGLLERGIDEPVGLDGTRSCRRCNGGEMDACPARIADS